jgi:hypothetical protein
MAGSYLAGGPRVRPEMRCLSAEEMDVRAEPACIWSDKLPRTSSDHVDRPELVEGYLTRRLIPPA